MENFDQLNLPGGLARAIKELGFDKPTPIQAQALPLLLEGATDFLGLAATGTGKTAAFGIPMLKRIEITENAIQGLVLCPTRELCVQVADQITKFGRYSGIRALPIYGGTGFVDQVKALRRGGNYVVVATPGRLLDHVRQENIELGSVKTVILDEADEMISMGFKEDMEAILKNIPRASSNIWLFSATMSNDLRRVADKFLRDPKTAQANKTEMLSTTVEQVYYTVRDMNKPKALCKLIESVDGFYGLVFCQTKSLVTALNDYLHSLGYPVDCLHGDKNQAQRDRTMKAFREKKVTVLICSDVAARGIDVKELTHVINYSLPRELDSYVHRIGRTARSGQAGVAISLVSPGQMGLIPRLEKLTRSKMKHGIIPSKKDISEKKLNSHLAAFAISPGHEKAEELLDDPWKLILESMSKTEIASRFLALAFPELFNGKDDAPDFLVDDNRSFDRPQRDREARYNGGGRSISGRNERRPFGGGERRFDDRRPSFDRPRPYQDRKNFSTPDAQAFSEAPPLSQGPGGGGEEGAERRTSGGGRPFMKRPFNDRKPYSGGGKFKKRFNRDASR